MEKEFIPYEEALALKELGFNENCFGFYADKTGEDITIYTVSTTQGSINSMSVHFNEGSPSYQFSAPTYSQAFRFFREKYPYRFYILPCSQHKKFLFEITLPSSIVYTSINDNAYDTYEEAELDCLKKLIEIVKNK